MSDRSETGYRLEAGQGPRFRTDVVDVYVFRRGNTSLEFLQLLRARLPLKATWQPVMGHIEQGERAPETAVRELGEEIALTPASPEWVGIWQLEQVYPYYLADLDAIVCSPRFAVEVTQAFTPTLNDEHSDTRWTSEPDDFMWPGQRLALEEIRTAIAPEHSTARAGLRLRIGPE